MKYQKGGKNEKKYYQDNIREIVLNLWELEEREYQYVAVELSMRFWFKNMQESDLELLHFLLKNKSKSQLLY